MFVALVAIALLTACVAAIYLLLKSMGQDGVEVAAPGSCKSGKCGVRNGTSTEAGCHQEDGQFDETDDVNEIPDPNRQHPIAEQQTSRLG